ncbi:hypothetical protein I79_008286 [Cricetulus griseus]|uniref:Uncharacterized protein n=1 Tax=Cricetulus griseus TaxID=10029 RepID=G3HCS1_CRIGR|nr:hypothetical protein I79_008286 [Cricetulus griseus]
MKLASVNLAASLSQREMGRCLLYVASALVTGGRDVGDTRSHILKKHKLKHHSLSSHRWAV